MSTLLQTPVDVLNFFADKGELPGDVFIFGSSIAVSYPGGMVPLSLVQSMRDEGLLEIRTERVPLAGPMAARVPPIQHTMITSEGKKAAKAED